MPICLWIMGRTAAGKSTLAKAISPHLGGLDIVRLDADKIRPRFWPDLGWTPADRRENIRRLASLARLFLDAGNHVVVAAVTPTEDLREEAKRIVVDESVWPEYRHRFFLIHVSTPIECCEARDPKCLYQMARLGSIENVAGVDVPFESPESPDFEWDSTREPTHEVKSRLYRFLCERFEI